MIAKVSYELGDGSKHLLLTVHVAKGQYFDLGRLFLSDDEPNQLKNIGLVLQPPTPNLGTILVRAGQRLVVEVDADPVEVPKTKAKKSRNQ